MCVDKSHFQFVAMHLFPYQVVQRINSIYCTKRGKKRLKKLSLSNIETASLRGKDFYHDVTSQNVPQLYMFRPQNVASWPLTLDNPSSLFVDDNSESESDSDDRFKGEGPAHMAEWAMCLRWVLLRESVLRANNVTWPCDFSQVNVKTEQKCIYYYCIYILNILLFYLAMFWIRVFAFVIFITFSPFFI